MEMSSTDIWLLFNILMGASACILSFVYFLRFRNQWRWIKLMYAISLFIFTSALIAAVSGVNISGDMQMLLIGILLATLLGGMIVSWAKALFPESKDNKNNKQDNLS
jgi:zinc transporter ZupT